MDSVIVEIWYHNHIPKLYIGTYIHTGTTTFLSQVASTATKGWGEGDSKTSHSSAKLVENDLDFKVIIICLSAAIASD